MPSPFPGMDPYLEHPVRWSGLHQRLITHIGDTLNALMPTEYVADIGERLYVVQPNRSVLPDVAVFESVKRDRTAAGGGVAVAERVDAPWVLTLDPVEVREVFVEIYPVADQSRVITVIEVLSLTNKTPGHQGQQLYLRKQRHVLDSDVHLVEIDLLRTGLHTVAPPRDALQEKGTWDYLVSLHRGGDGERYEVWPISLRERLPEIRVPLAGDDPDVVLDLQAVFDQCYDAGGYARRLDYNAEPAVPLRPEDVEWADALLRAAGRRG